MNMQSYKCSLIIQHENYIVKDHQLHGVRLLPGATFLDILFRYMSSKGYRPADIEIRNLLFKEPVATSMGNDKKIMITMELSNSYWIVKAVSQTYRAGEQLEDNWKENLQCEIHLSTNSISKHLDLEKLRLETCRTEDMDMAYEFSRNAGLVHYDFLKLQGKIYLMQNDLVAEVHLSSLAQTHLDDFFIHPAFLDGALSTPAILSTESILEAKEDTGRVPYIPIHIDSFRAFGGLGEKCFVRVPREGIEIPPSKDIMYADIELYDSHGNLKAIYKRFAAKRVRSEELIHLLVGGNREEETPLPIANYKHEVFESRTVSPQKISLTVIKSDLRNMVADILQITPDNISLEGSYYEQGLDSRQLLDWVLRIEQKLGKQLYPTLLFDYTNINQLAQYLYTEFDEKYPVDHLYQATTSKNEESPSGIIAQYLLECVSELSGRAFADVHPEESFYNQGLDSRQLLQLAGVLESKIGSALYPTLLFDHNNIMDLSAYLSAEYGAQFVGESKANKESVQTVLDPSPVADYQVEVSVPDQTEENQGETGYFVPVWEPSSYTPENIHIDAKHILVFGTEQLVNQLVNSASIINRQQVTLVKPEDYFGIEDDRSFSINPHSEQDYESLIQSLEEHDISYDHVLYLWPFLSKADDSLENQLAKGIYPLSILCRLLSRGKKKANIVFGFPGRKGELDAHFSAVSAFAKTVFMENPSIRIKTVRLIDSGRAKTPSSKTMLSFMKSLVNELAIGSDQEREIQYVKGNRLLKQYQQVAPTLEHGAAPFKEQGVYIITGGLGGLGYQFAVYLTSRFKARVILTGRSALTAENEKRILELEKSGGKALYIQTDIASSTEVRRMVDEIKLNYGTINGIIHCAGITKDALIYNKTLTDFKEVLSAKVKGALVLKEELLDESLDIVLLFSSISAVLGNPGQSDYAFANAYLDQFAEWYSNQRDKCRVLSINWPYWEQGGMKLEPSNVEMIKKRTGLLPLDMESGFSMLEEMLSLDAAQILGVKGDLKKLIHIPAVTWRTLPLKSESLICVQQENRAASSGLTPIEILGATDRLDHENFVYYWKNLKEGHRKSIGHVNVEKEYIRLTKKCEPKMIHMLVQTSSDVKFEVITAGYGETIVLIPGFASTASMWVHQIKDWSSKYNVVAMNCPGFGLSEAGADTSFTSISDSIVEMLEQLEVQWPVHVVAASWGGMIAQTLASRHKSKIASLILSGSFAEVYEDPNASIKEKIRIDFEYTQDKESYSIISDNEMLNSTGMPFVQKFRENGYSTVELLQDIKVPTLIVCGGKDAAVEQKQFYLLYERIPNAVLYALPEAGHAPNLTHHQQFNSRVTQFIGETKAEEKWLNKLFSKRKTKLLDYEKTTIKNHLGVLPAMMKKHITESNIFKYKLSLQTPEGYKEITAIMKRLAPEKEMEAMFNNFAHLSNKTMLSLFEQHKDILGLSDNHVHETEFYKLADAALLKYCPVVYDIRHDKFTNDQLILMEDLSTDEFAQFNSVNKIWDCNSIECVLKDLAQLHAVYLNRYEDIPPLMKVQSYDEGGLSKARKLLKELVTHNAKSFPDLIDDDMRLVYVEYIDNIDKYAQQMADFPKTLTHNDFNPRNICLRKSNGNYKLVAYDWELARYQNPQHDVIEFLLFVLDENSGEEQFNHYIHVYMNALKEQSGLSFTTDEFMSVLKCNLLEYGVTRINLYLLAHYFLRFEYMEKVYGNIKKLIHMFNEEQLELKI